nr:hypothetical protein [Tanacetum cinerariifolium]
MVQELPSSSPAHSVTSIHSHIQPLNHPCFFLRDTFNLCLHAWYLDDGTIVRDSLVIDPRSKVAGVFPPNISQPLHGVKLLGGPVSVDHDFISALVMERVSKTIGLLDTVAKINDPHCELLLIHACAGISKVYFGMCTCPLVPSSQLNFLLTLLFVLSWSILSRLLDWGLATDNGDSPHYPLHLRALTFIQVASCGPNFWVRADYEWEDLSGMFMGTMLSCAGVIGIKHRHNTVRDTLVDICFQSGILAGKEVDIGLSGDDDKALRSADMLLYSWDGGLDVCVDLTGSSPLTRTGMADSVLGRAVIDAAQRKRGKYMAKCAAIGYGFLPFSFSSLGELETDAVTLLRRIRKFSMAQDIGACAAIHIFNRISFAIAKEVRAQIVSRLPSNML